MRGVFCSGDLAGFGVRTLPKPLLVVGIGAMEGMVHVELTPHERDVLLRGLRYVRSAVMLEQREPTPDVIWHRSTQLDEIQNLSQRLENADPLAVPMSQ